MGTVIMMMLVEYPVSTEDGLIFWMLLHTFWQAATTDMLIQTNHAMRALHHPLQVMRDH